MYIDHMINSSTAEKEIIRKIEQHIHERGTTRKHVFDRARMSRQTFERAMSGGRSFTIEEIVNISAALGLSPVDLLPEEWGTSAQAA